MVPGARGSGPHLLLKARNPVTSSLPSTCDVAIIGCGPVGAMAANLLAHEGLAVAVLEQSHEHYPLPRAVHLDHEMMRLFQTAGVVDRVLPDMVATDGHLHVGADHGAIRYMGTLGRPKPFGWSNDYFFYQPELEAHLRAAFADTGKVALQSGASFTGLESDARGVTVRYRCEETEHRIRARWVIAADGARSSVRKHLGIALDDLGFEEPWLVVDAEVEGPLSFPALHGVPADADLQQLSVMMCDPQRPATVVPGRRNHRRWEFMLLPGEEDAAMMEPQRVAALLHPWLKDVPHRIVRASTYRFHGLVAQRWQQDRVFLAGDAAHQTPPFFGQGMCHGFRDVDNLAWKMGAIARQEADEAILGTYQTERDPHVRTVIEAAIAAGRYICELDPARAAARDQTIRSQAAERAGETAADLIPAIRGGLVLADSRGSGQRFIQPTLSDGRKLDDLAGQGWRLFVRDSGPQGAIAASQLPDDGAVTAWLDVHDAEAVLVRPDHYVFGTGHPAKLLAARAAMLGMSEDVAA
jgi:3-(3-hydroxy-phenyl)propionate hydroxylase